ncbi:putative tetratricopeptide repeat protein 41 [Gastrophryne carolinensis]
MHQPVEHPITTYEDQQYYFMSRPAIHPYICSTPTDFLEEKTYLAQTIFPQLDRFCLMRGTSFKAVDLKWPTKKQSNTESHVRSDYTKHEQLKLCLDYINTSSPFFICLLGHTYGEWLQASSDLPELSRMADIEQDFMVAANGGYPWVLEGKNKDCSFTELQIIQASFLKESPFQFYYFRDYLFIEDKLLQAGEQEKKCHMSTFASEDENEQWRIWDLKVRIVDKGLPVKFFKTKEELGQLILEDWCDVIEKLCPIKATPGNIGHEHNLAQAYHQAYAESLCTDFVASQRLHKLFSLLDSFAGDDMIHDNTSFDDHNTATTRNKKRTLRKSYNMFSVYRLKTDRSSILLLHGDQGCGKSTAIAQWLRLFTTGHPNVTVISYFVGSSGRCDDITCFMRYCIILLQCNYFGIQPEDIYSSENINDLWDFTLLVEAFLASVALRPCILVLDAVDELSGIPGLSTQQAKGFTWLPASLPPHYKMILTTRSHHLSYKHLLTRPDTQTAEFPAITDTEERVAVIHQHLAMPSRHIGPYFLEIIDNKKKKMTTLQLAVLASELRMCPDLMTCMDGHLEAQSTLQLWTLLMQHWVKHYSWPCEQISKKKMPNSTLASGLPNTGWVLDVLCFICISHCGLHEDDILQLLRKRGYQNQHEVTPQHWVAFRSATSKWIREKPDGLLQIYPHSFTDAATLLLLGVAMPISECLDSSFYTTDHKRKQLHYLLLKHFQQKGLCRQVYEEVPWHLMLTGKLNELYRFLFIPSTLGLICKYMRLGKQMTMDVIRYWQMLVNAGKDPALKCQMMLQGISETKGDLTAECRIMSFAAQCLIHIGRTKEAMAILSSVEHLLELSESDNKVLLWTHKIMGDLYENIGSWQKASIYYKKALGDVHHLKSANLHNDGQIQKLEGRLLSLIALLKAKICIEESSEVPSKLIEHFQVSNEPYEQAAMKLCQGLYKLSIGEVPVSKKYLVECLELRQKLHGKEHILCGEIQEYLADIQSHPSNSNYFQRLSALENYKEVIKIKEDAEKRSPSLEIRENLKLSLSNTLLKLGKLLCHSDFGRGKEAVEILQRCLDLRTSSTGFDRTSISEVQFLLKELKGRHHSSSWSSSSVSKMPVLGTDVPRSTGTASHRRHFIVHSAPCYRKSELQVSTVALSPSHDYKSKLFLLGRNKIHNMTTIEDWKLQDEKNEGLICYQENFSVIPVLKPCSVPSSCKSASRPASVCLTSTTGPLSDVLSLVSDSKPSSKSRHYKSVHKSAWYHVPGRYATPQTPFPPKRPQICKEA